MKKRGNIIMGYHHLNVRKKIFATRQILGTQSELRTPSWVLMTYRSRLQMLRRLGAIPLNCSQVRGSTAMASKIREGILDISTSPHKDRASSKAFVPKSIVSKPNDNTTSGTLWITHHVTSVPRQSHWVLFA